MFFCKSCAAYYIKPSKRAHIPMTYMRALFQVPNFSVLGIQG